MKILAAILTKNEANHIGNCLATLQWTNGVILEDSFSDDSTIEIARALEATIFQSPFANFSVARNNALENARQLGADWLFFVDADERVTPVLALEILEILSIIPDDNDVAGWWVPRYNVMWGHTMQGGGWYPDHQLRLLKVGAARYDPQRQVHELAELDGVAGYLREHLLHYNYDSLSHFQQKQNRYADFEAEILREKGIRPKSWTYLTMPAREFYRRYVSLGGYKDGWRGVQLCGLMSWYMFLTYTRLKRLGEK
jgi:hypothetical protein